MMWADNRSKDDDADSLAEVFMCTSGINSFVRLTGGVKGFQWVHGRPKLSGVTVGWCRLVTSSQGAGASYLNEPPLDVITERFGAFEAALRPSRTPADSAMSELSHPLMCVVSCVVSCVCCGVMSVLWHRDAMNERWGLLLRKSVVVECACS